MNAQTLERRTTAMHETKPCPFCGEDPPLASMPIWPAGFRLYIVGCENENCPAAPQVSGHTLAEAWANWNRRA